MTPARMIAIAAGAAIAGLFANAIRLAAADPAEAAVRSADPPAKAPATAATVGTVPRAGRAASAGKWSAPGKPHVSPGVLARAASRKPLERAPACTQARAPEAPSAAERCPPPERGDAEQVEIDWHADPATL